MTFVFDGKTFDLFDHPYNDAALNERAVEIPLAREFIRQHGVDLEVGNVLSHYGDHDHPVIDRYEEDPDVANVDVFDISGHYPSVVAISTLEHVRWDEPDIDPYGAVRALEHLRSISDHLFVTVPAGWHPVLDTHLLVGDHGATKVSTLIRCSHGWEQTEVPTWKRYKATTVWAESVFIGEWGPS